MRDMRPIRIKFRDDGYIPNNPKFPLVYYPKVVRFGRKQDPTAVIDKIIDVNGWGDSWRGGIYDFVHYHDGVRGIEI